MKKAFAILIALLPFLVGAQSEYIYMYSPDNDSLPYREKTLYIVLHTTEGPFLASLYTVRPEGLCNFMIKENGDVVVVVDHERLAYHAGTSMWQGLDSLSYFSVGIEVVGYHNGKIKIAQKESLEKLVRYLLDYYCLTDIDVVTHSMVAYQMSDKHGTDRRGRKRCAMNMASDEFRESINLSPLSVRDEDVLSGRLVVGDKYLEKVLYGINISQEEVVRYQDSISKYAALVDQADTSKITSYSLSEICYPDESIANIKTLSYVVHAKMPNKRAPFGVLPKKLRLKK